MNANIGNEEIKKEDKENRHYKEHEVKAEEEESKAIKEECLCS
jgi:hypothetical protein